MKKTFGRKVGQRKPFVTFCNFLFPNCTPGLCIKSIADFLRLAYCGPITYPPANCTKPALAFCAILTLAFCGITAIIINVKSNTKPPNASPKSHRKKIKNFSERGLTNHKLSFIISRVKGQTPTQVPDSRKG